MTRNLSDEPPVRKPRLMEQVRERLRAQYYSIRTEEAYLAWIRRFILFHGKRHPKEMGGSEVARFLSALAVKDKVSPSTQNQAFSALLFLYRDVLKQPLDDLGSVKRAQRKQKTPVVLTKEEARRLLAQLEGLDWLMAMLLYGSGLRLLEMLRLRVKDVDFGYLQITIRDARPFVLPPLVPYAAASKGAKDRVTTLPESVVGPLKRHLERRKLEHERDVREGRGSVYLPFALERKCKGAPVSFAWQYLFAARSFSEDRRSAEVRCHHIDELTVQRMVKRAAERAGVHKVVTPHTLRHSSATHMHDQAAGTLQGTGPEHYAQKLESSSAGLRREGTAPLVEIPRWEPEADGALTAPVRPVGPEEADGLPAVARPVRRGADGGPPGTQWRPVSSKS